MYGTSVFYVHFITRPGFETDSVVFFSSVVRFWLVKQTTTISQVLMFLHCRGQVSQINSAKWTQEACVKFCIFKSEPHSTSARAPGNAFWLVDNCHTIGLRGIYITCYGLRITGYTFWSSIENFSVYCQVLRGSSLLPPRQWLVGNKLKGKHGKTRFHFACIFLRPSI